MDSIKGGLQVRFLPSPSSRSPPPPPASAAPGAPDAFAAAAQPPTFDRLVRLDVGPEADAEGLGPLAHGPGVALHCAAVHDEAGRRRSAHLLANQVLGRRHVGVFSAAAAGGGTGSGGEGRRGEGGEEARQLWIIRRTAVVFPLFTMGLLTGRSLSAPPWPLVLVICEPPAVDVAAAAIQEQRSFMIVVCYELRDDFTARDARAEHRRCAFAWAPTTARHSPAWRPQRQDSYCGRSERRGASKVAAAPLPLPVAVARRLGALWPVVLALGLLVHGLGAAGVVARAGAALLRALALALAGRVCC